MKEKNLILSKKWLLIIWVILLFIVICIGISYAFWKFNLSQSDTNAIASDCFDIAFTEESDNINLLNSFPLTDEDGAK